MKRLFSIAILCGFLTMTEMERAKLRLATMGIDALRMKKTFPSPQLPAGATVRV